MYKLFLGRDCISNVSGNKRETNALKYKFLTFVEWKMI